MTKEEMKELDEIVKFLEEDPDFWYRVEYSPELDEDGNDVGGTYIVSHNGKFWEIDPSVFDAKRF